MAYGATLRLLFITQRGTEELWNRSGSGISAINTMRIRCLIGVFAVVLCTSTAFAQDVIHKKDGTKVEAKILSVNEDYVEFKRWNNQQGPTFAISIEKVFKIVYSNGDVDVFDEPVEKPAQQPQTTSSQVTSNDMSDAILLSRIADLEAKAKHINAVGNWVETISGFAVLGGTVAIGMVNDWGEGATAIVGALATSAVLLGEISLFNSSENSYKSQADALRNQLKHTAMLSISPSIIKSSTNNTLASGLALTFRF